MDSQDYTDLLALYGIGGAHPGGLELTKEILMKKNLQGQNVLEVGCGTGQTTSYLHTLGCRLTAIDLHSLMIEKANNRFLKENIKCKAILMDIEETTFSDNQFDYVIAESVLSFTNIIKSLPEINRILTKNGSLIALEMTRKKTMPAKTEKILKNFYGIPTILSKSAWKEACEKSGFQDVHVSLISLDELTPSEPEINPSFDIEPRFFEVMEKHEELTSSTSEYLELSFITAKKEGNS